MKNITQDDWTDHPRVVEMLTLPKAYTEMIFVNEEEWRKVSKNMIIQSGDFGYSSSERIIFVKVFTQSQCTRAVSVREMESFCSSLNIDTVYLIKNDKNSHIIKELAKKISELSK